MGGGSSRIKSRTLRKGVCQLMLEGHGQRINTEGLRKVIPEGRSWGTKQRSTFAGTFVHYYKNLEWWHMTAMRTRLHEEKAYEWDEEQICGSRSRWVREIRPQSKVWLAASGGPWGWALSAQTFRPCHNICNNILDMLRALQLTIWKVPKGRVKQSNFV